LILIQEEEAAAWRASEEAAKEAARAEEEARARVQAAEQAEREKEQKRAAVIQNIKVRTHLKGSLGASRTIFP
jgi:hypothetical protein